MMEQIGQLLRLYQLQNIIFRVVEHKQHLLFLVDIRIQQMMYHQQVVMTELLLAQDPQWELLDMDQVQLLRVQQLLQ